MLFISGITDKSSGFSCIYDNLRNDCLHFAERAIGLQGDASSWSKQSVTVVSSSFLALSSYFAVILSWPLLSPYFAVILSWLLLSSCPGYCCHLVLAIAVILSWPLLSSYFAVILSWLLLSSLCYNNQPAYHHWRMLAKAACKKLKTEIIRSAFIFISIVVTAVAKNWQETSHLGVVIVSSCHRVVQIISSRSNGADLGS